jgi:hypothetical protein
VSDYRLLGASGFMDFLNTQKHKIYVYFKIYFRFYKHDIFFRPQSETVRMDVNGLKETLAENGQEHLLKYWDSL